MQITIEEAGTVAGVRIKVIGVGGGGSNMISHLIAQGAHKDIELAVANTDSQALTSSLAPLKIQLGTKLTKGLGAGMKPDTGRNAALESFDEIRDFLVGTDLVFISAGLGGGTGTGAAPIIAQAAKEAGALTVSVVTKPFKFEGSKRAKLAEQGLSELKQESDSIVVIPNDKLLSIVDKNLGIKDSFKIVDDVLARAVNGMSGIILNHGENDINVDFADVKTIMSHRGLALMGIGESTGSSASCEAIRNAIESPLFDNISINGALGILVNWQFHPEYPTQEINNAMGIINEYGNDETDIIFGTMTDITLPKDMVRVTIVATGFEKELVKQNQEREGNTLKLVPSKDLTQSAKQQPSLATGGSLLKKVSSGDYEHNEDILDVPTFMRRQMD